MTQDNFDLGNVIEGLSDSIRHTKSREKYTSTATSIAGGNTICLPLLAVIIRKYLFFNRKQPVLNDEKKQLGYFGIQNLAFTINNKSLYRVFNRNSFTLGGRFYGGSYQVLPKEFRPHIKINNAPTVELDYAAHHIRIAYHLEDIEYQDDPYLAISDNPGERQLFKQLLLVIINAETEAAAMSGFRDKIRGNAKYKLEDLNNSTIKPLINRVKEAHPRIADYFHSGAGRRLQNLDSQITEGILMIMTKEGIPCLPIHDSYIVPVQHEKQLREVMMSEYHRVLGFDPVIA